jgi:hypothetical protein
MASPGTTPLYEDEEDEDRTQLRYVSQIKNLTDTKGCRNI